METGVRGLSLIEAGMDLRDIDGVKLGIAARVLPATTTHDDVVEIRTGLLGLGRPRYVPLRLIQGVSGNRVYLWQTRDRIEREYPDSDPRQC